MKKKIVSIELVIIADAQIESNQNKTLAKKGKRTHFPFFDNFIGIFYISKNIFSANSLFFSSSATLILTITKKTVLSRT